MIKKINRWLLQKKLENTKTSTAKRSIVLKKEAAEIKETNALQQAIKEASNVKKLLSDEEIEIITKARENTKNKKEETLKWLSDNIIKASDGLIKAIDTISPPKKKKKK